MFKQLLNTFFTKILSGFLNLAIAIIISNYLGADGKGVQGLILTTISIIIIFTGIVGSGGLTYLLPRLHFYLLIVPSYLWTIITIAFMWIALSLIKVVPEEYNIHIVLLTVFLSVTGINNSILQAQKKIQKINLINITQIIITLSVISYLIVYKKVMGVESYITGLYFGYIFSAVLSFVYTWKDYTKYPLVFPTYKYLISLKKHFKYGGYNQLDILAQVLSFRLAYYFLNSFTGVSEVGVYSNAVSIIESVWLLSRSIAFVMHSRIVNSRDKTYTVGLTVKFIKLTGVVAFMWIIALIFIPSAFYQFVFGHDFGGIRTAILSLSPGILFFSISFVISSYFSGTGKHYINSISSIIGLIVIVISSLIFIPQFGIIGAGISASLSYFMTTLIKMISFCKIGSISLKQFVPTLEDIGEIKELLKIKK